MSSYDGPPPMPWEGWAVQRLDIEGAQVVTASGELDLRCKEALLAELDAAFAVADARLVIDLSAVTFIDCSALNVLVAAAQRAQAANRVVQLVSSRAVERLMVLSQTATFFEDLNDRSDD